MSARNVHYAQSDGLQCWTCILEYYVAITASQCQAGNTSVTVGIIVQNWVSGLLHTNPAIIPLPDGLLATLLQLILAPISGFNYVGII